SVEAAAELVASVGLDHPARKALEPLLAVLAQQLPFALLQSGLPGVVLRQPGALALDADELGAGGVAILLQPVGVHQPWRVVIGALGDGRQEGLLGVHGSSLSETGTNHRAHFTQRKPMWLAALVTSPLPRAPGR